MERWASLAERAASWPNTRTELRKHGDAALSSGERTGRQRGISKSSERIFQNTNLPFTLIFILPRKLGSRGREGSEKNTRMYILNNRASLSFPLLVTLLNINNLEGCICVWCLSEISAFHFMYASMYVFICHLIPERMADGLKWYIKYQKRSIKNRNKLPKRKQKLEM